MIKKYSDIIVLLIIWAFSIYSIIAVINNEYIIGIQNYLGYGLLILLTGIRFVKIKNYNKILVGFLLLGTLNIIQFTYWTQIFFFRINASGEESENFGLQPLCFFVLLFFIVLNFSTAMKFLFHSDNKSDLIKKHYDDLNEQSDEDLDKIIKKEKSVEKELIVAAQIIIKERKKMYHSRL